MKVQARRGKLLGGFRRITPVLLLLAAVILLAVPASAIENVPMRTVFVIGDISDSGTTGEMVPLQAYIVYGDQLILAQTFSVPTRFDGAVGLAVDHDNELLFLSFEGLSGQSDRVDVFNARTATYSNTIVLPNTGNLCGMVVHQGRHHLYVVNRDEKNVFVFDNDNSFSSVETWVLPTGSGAWGLDIIDDFLFVAAPSTAHGTYIRWYDIDTHMEVGNVTTLPYDSTAVVAIDTNEGYKLFSTAFYGGIGNQERVQRYIVNSAQKTSWVTPRTHAKGISADPTQEILYVAYGRDYIFGDDGALAVYDYDGNLLNDYPLPNGWRPTDVVATAIPFGGTVKKTLISHPSGIIQSGDSVTFEIEVTNDDTTALTFVPLQDVYDTAHLSFVSANPAPVDSTNDGQLDWADLTTSFGMNLNPGQTFTVTVEFKAVTCFADVEGSNLARVEGAQDTLGSLMYAAGVADYEINCGCTLDAHCDDGLYCNGEETCDDGDCIDGEEPCSDDGEYCNGTETCDEENKKCVSTGDPCSDDGVYCNGSESCNELQDSCSHSGSPCADDDKFCNGTETCVEETKECLSSGDPCQVDSIFCNGDEFCNEEDDKCDRTGDPCPDGTVCDEESQTCNAGDGPTPTPTPPPDASDDDDVDQGDPDSGEDVPDAKVSGGCCGC